MKILGIDPGSSRVGYGTVMLNNGKLSVENFGLIESREKLVINKIFDVAKQFDALISRTMPDLIAIEKIYFSKNQKTIIEVSEARGAFIFLTLIRNIKILEYTPQEVKQATTNDGHADKKGVTRMVCKILGIKTAPKPDDVTDALAIAITAANRYRFDLVNNTSKTAS